MQIRSNILKALHSHADDTFPGKNACWKVTFLVLRMAWSVPQPTIECQSGLEDISSNRQATIATSMPPMLKIQD